MTTSHYDFWLFDLDGTLVDVEPRYARRVMRTVGDRISYEFTDREIRDLWHGLGGDPDELLRKRDIDPEHFWTTFHSVEDSTARAKATILYADAERVLPTIDRPIGLVTHCQRYLTEPVLDRLDIADWFDTVICCTEETGWKPDPTPVEIAMEQLGVDSSARGILVGDSPLDIGAAWNVGLDGAHVERHGHDQRGLCVRGDHRVSRLDELTARSPAMD